MYYYRLLWKIKLKLSVRVHIRLMSGCVCVSGLTMSSCVLTRWMFGMWLTAERWRRWRRRGLWFDSTSAGGNPSLRKWWRSNWWRDPKVTPGYILCGFNLNNLRAGRETRGWSKGSFSCSCWWKQCRLCCCMCCWIDSACLGALVKSLRASWLFRQEARLKNKASVSTETSWNMLVFLCVFFAFMCPDLWLC